jgi:benzil reductase ((S)-benzoin forming)
MAAIFITGHSHGIGLGLTRHYLDRGDTVYAASRNPCELESPSLQQAKLDLSRPQDIAPVLTELLPARLDLVILNAGILGEIKDLADTSQDEVDRLMTINVWSNKVIIDWLIKQRINVRQLVLMSSGASVNGNRGWGAYSLSKAAINMLAKLYAHEMPDTHITAFAPGIVRTRMQDYLCREVDTDKFPSIASLANAYGSDYMPEVERAAPMLANAFERCLQHESGSFLDIRQL